MISSLGRALPRLEGHEGLGPLAPFLVRDGHHRALHHRRMPGHALLDLDGGDVLAARDDDVLLAIAQLDVAVGVPDPDVAGVEPSAPEGLARWRRAARSSPWPRCCRRMITSPRVSPSAGHVVHLVVHHPHQVEEGVALALPRGQARLLVGGQRVPLRVPAADGVGPVGLGEAVDVNRPEAELLELAEERGRGRRARHRHRHRPRELVGLRVVDDADLHGGGAVVVGDALRVDQLPDARRLDLLGGRRACPPPR